jgi:hypothetical protein
MTDTEGYYKNNWVVKYTPPKAAANSAAHSREAELADADIIEIDEETGNLSVTTEVSAKNKMKSTIPKTNGKCLIRLEE